MPCRATRSSWTNRATPGSDVYCPKDHGFTETIAASAPFTVSPVAGGSYILQSFYDYTGDFLPTFKIRQLPERGDVAGGDIDTAQALEEVNAGNPNFQPHFLEVDVGIPEPLPLRAAGATAVPVYDIPDNGYVAANVNVAVGAVLPTTRPYFYAQGFAVSLSPDQSALSSSVVESSEVDYDGGGGVAGTVEADPHYVPILTIPQDIQALSCSPRRSRPRRPTPSRPCSRTSTWSSA